MQPDPETKKRFAIRQTTGIVAIGIFATIAVFFSLMVVAGIFWLPMAQQASEAASRQEKMIHLKQIGQALHNYNPTNVRLPPTRRNQRGQRNQRGPDSFTSVGGGNLTRGRPLGRMVDCKPNCLTVDSTQSVLPNGRS